MNDMDITRRDSMLTLGAAAAGAWIWGSNLHAACAGTINPEPKRVLRVAHLTDLHVQPELRASEGMAACLRHVQQLADPPELIITGGDSIMDSFDADDARTRLQWELWHQVLKNECSIPIRSCIGNHDIWGWSRSKSKTTGREPLWGKKRATDMLHLDERYYSFPSAGWQIIVLDSTQQLPDGGEGYCAYLDEPQFDWLAATLRANSAKAPVLIVSHIPILSASAILWSNEDHGDFRISSGLMHTDCVKLKELFAKHPNVKLCVSGHLHLVDRVEYNGVTHFCNGAVSGNWWKGRHKDCDEGYALLDLYDDGSFEREYVKYGWRAADSASPDEQAKATAPVDRLELCRG